MPKDQRLYMTFPNDFHRHPKLQRLPVEARWAFVEMNGEARIADNDGVFKKEDAEFMWSATVLDALVNSHPTRPLVVRDQETYVIRDYAEHQQTRQERADLAGKRSEAGRAGARKRWADSKPMASAKQVHGKPWQAIAEIETELEIEKERELSPRKRAHTIPSDFTINPAMREWAKDNTPSVDIDAKLPEFIDYWTGTGKTMKDWTATWRNGMRKQQEFAERDKTKRKPNADWALKL